MNEILKQRLKEARKTDIAKMHVGIGATKFVGSDAYPYYVVEAKLTTAGKYVVGMYSPGSHFEKSWADGHEVVDAFDPSHKPEFWITLYRNHWWKCNSNGERLKPYRKDEYAFGYASAYRDPSF